MLQVATNLVAASGFNTLSLDAVAQASGITKSGVLHHFPSKDDLLVAVLERRDHLDASAVADLLSHHSGTVFDAGSSRALLDALVRRNLTQPTILKMYSIVAAEALDPGHVAHEYFSRRLAASTRLLGETVFAWHAAGHMAALQVLAFLDGLQVNWLRAPEIDFFAQWSTFADSLYATVLADHVGGRPPDDTRHAGRAPD